jgi:hypothetical protein
LALGPQSTNVPIDAGQHPRQHWLCNGLLLRHRTPTLLK